MDVLFPGRILHWHDICRYPLLATAANVVFYGPLEGYQKAVDARTGKELYRFKTLSGGIGNVTTWMHNGKQYVGVLSGIGGWAGIGLAAGKGAHEGLGAVSGYKGLAKVVKVRWLGIRERPQVGELPFMNRFSLQ